MKKPFFILMLFSLVVAGMWDNLPAIKNTIHAILDPTLGFLLSAHLLTGFLIITLLVTFATTLIQKYGTDQAALKGLKEEQKALQQEMKQHQQNPQKMLEIQKKQLEQIPRTFELTLQPLIYTAIPFVLLLRWFSDTFKNLNNPEFFGFLSWFWAYLIFTIIFSILLRKLLKVY